MPRNYREILLKEQKTIFDLEDEGSTFIRNIIPYTLKDVVSCHQRLESAQPRESPSNLTRRELIKVGARQKPTPLLQDRSNRSTAYSHSVFFLEALAWWVIME
jgi:hypothetical protein